MNDSHRTLLGHMDVAMTLDSAHLPEGAVALASLATHISRRVRIDLVLFADNSLDTAARATWETSLQKLGGDIAVTWVAAPPIPDRDKAEALFQVLQHFCGKKVLIFTHDVLFLQDASKLYGFFSDTHALSGVADYDAAFRSDAAYLSGSPYVNTSLLWADLRRFDPEEFAALGEKAGKDTIAPFPGADCRDVLNRAFKGQIHAIEAFWEPQGRSNAALRLVFPGRDHTNSPTVLLYGGMEKNAPGLDRRRASYLRKTSLYAEFKHCEQSPVALLRAEAAAACTRAAKYCYAAVLRKHVENIQSKIEYAHALSFRHIRNRLLEINAKERKKKDFLLPGAIPYDVVATFEEAKHLSGKYGDKHTYASLFATRRLTECDILDGTSGKTAAIFHILRNTKIKKQISFLLLALENAVDLYFVETGLVCCVTNIIRDDIPLRFWRKSAYLVDDIGFYYDAMLPTRLESYLNSDASALSNEECNRAERLREFLVRHRISKYNYQPIALPPGLRIGSRNILVVDQSKKDASISRGMADATTFRDMLDAAIRENPDAEIFIKTHPDSLNQGRGAYFTDIPSGGRIHKIIESVNPYSLFEHMDAVYVCSSNLGLEALFCNKEVHVFGMPAYAGWGLTRDRQRICRRTRKLSLHELIYALYIQFSIYFDPFTGERIEVEPYLESMLKLRAEYFSLNDQESFRMVGSSATMMMLNSRPKEPQRTAYAYNNIYYSERLIFNNIFLMSLLNIVQYILRTM